VGTRATFAQTSARKSQARGRPSSSKFLAVTLPSKKVRCSPFPMIRIHKFPLASDIYTARWKNLRTPCPGIKKVYTIVMKPDFEPKYEDYRYEFLYLDPLAFHPPLRYSRRKLPSLLSHRPKGNEKRVWLEARRDCGFGNTGNMEPCTSNKCALCSLVRSSVSKEVAQYPIGTTPSLARYLIKFQAHNPFLTNSQSH
jgi:hypothetical protein